MATETGSGYGDMATEGPEKNAQNQPLMTGADGSVAQMAGLSKGDTIARPDALNEQSQIAYDYEEE